jgi:hypothetical protein
MVKWLDVLVSILSSWGGPRFWTRRGTQEEESEGRGWPLGACFLLLALILLLVQIIRRG